MTASGDFVHYHEFFANTGAAPQRVVVGAKSPAWDGMGEWPGIDVAELAAQAALPPQILPEYVDLTFTFQEIADGWKFWNRPRFYTCQTPADFYRAEQARLENEADEAKVARQRSHPDWVRLNRQLEAAGYETADCYECGGVNDVDDFTDRLMDQMHGRDWRDVK